MPRDAGERDQQRQGGLRRPTAEYHILEVSSCQAMLSRQRDLSQPLVLMHRAH